MLPWTALTARLQTNWTLSAAAAKKEATLVLIKPDGLKKSLTGNILTRLSETKLEIIAANVKEMNHDGAVFRYHPNDLYDFMIGSLFLNRMGPDRINRIYFARRKKKDRTTALKEAILQHYATADSHSAKQLQLLACNPWEHGGLQAVDYYLWAVQRQYERGETRYRKLLDGFIEDVWKVDFKN